MSPQSNVKEVKHNASKNTTVKFSHAIETYGDGIRLVAPHRGGKNDQSGKHLRGEIKGWSKSSRKRMRSFLMTSALPGEYLECAATFTIPGYPLPYSQAQELFLKWRKIATFNEWAVVWRVELQKRGQLHWHCIIGIKDGQKETAGPAIKESWHRALELMGKIEYRYLGFVYDPWPTAYVTGVQGLMEWRGSDRYSAHVDFMGDNGSAWKRYLLDHTTKVKQEQIPENIGRHWGVIGRKQFVEVLPKTVQTFTPQEYAKFMRCLNRMWTPYLRHDGALFGRRRGYTVKRGKMGKTDLFTKSLPSVQRLVEWVLQQRPNTIKA